MVSDSRKLVAGIDARQLLGWVGVLVLALLVLVFVAVAVPQLVGADHSYVVQSSSMSPTIGAGSVVFVDDVPGEAISEGDVITFTRSTADGSTRVTHRVVDVGENGGQRWFQTKGDANEDPDSERVPADQVVGSVSFQIPLIGYVVGFVQTPLGTLLLVVIPAIVLLVLEARDLLTEAEETAEDER